MGSGSERGPGPPTLPGLRQLSRAELLLRLNRLEVELATLRRRERGGREDALHELQVHKVELEMQNRELQETQGALEESLGRYAELYHSAPTGFVTLERTGVIVEANATICVMLAAKRTHLLHGAFAVYLAPEARTLFFRCLEACFREPGEHSVEVTLQPRTGPNVAVQVCARRAQGRWGPGEHAHVSLLNVSDRHMLDEQLKFLLGVSDALTGTLDPEVVGARVARLPVPFLADAAAFTAVTRPDQIELSVAPSLGAWQRGALLALTRALQCRALVRHLEDVRRPLSIALGASGAEAQFVGPEVRLEARRLGLRSVLVLPAASRQDLVGTIVLYQHQDVPARGHVADFYQDFARRIGIAIDNAQLFQRSRGESQARRNLLAMVSHDLRSPLSVVLLKAEQMLAAAEAPKPTPLPRLRRGANVVLRCARRMNDLIGDLLDATNIESGSFHVVVAPVRLEGVVTEAIEAAQDALAAKGLTLTVAVEGELWASCDRRRTLQVLANIFANAAKFSERGGEVGLRVSGEGPFCLFRVADTGVGMDAATCARVFDRFWQASGTAHMGSGLGLHICRGIVEASGGKIWVDSVLGMGSTFSFTLPRLPPLLPPPTGGGRGADEVLYIGSRQGEAVLACEDAVQQRGLRLVQVDDDAEALAYLAQGARPRCVIVELCAPDGVGWAYARRRDADARLQELPVVAIGREAALAQHLHAPRTHFVLRRELATALAPALQRAEAEVAQQVQARATLPH